VQVTKPYVTFMLNISDKETTALEKHVNCGAEVSECDVV
jgi:hypothetical protein